MALSIKRAERRVAVCLDGSLVAQHEAITKELAAKTQAKAVDNRLNDPIAKLQRQQHELYEAQEASTVFFLIRGLPRSKWDEFVQAHPKRDDHELDKEYGFNTDTIFDAILSSEDPASIIEVNDHKGKPVKDWGGPSEWAEFSGNLTRAQYEGFRSAVVAVNGGTSAVPFSLTAYRASQNSGSSSK